MPIVATRAPQKPATRYPTNVAVMTTGPGLIIPMATATRNSRSLSHPVCWTRPFSRKGTITSPLPKVSEPAFRKNVNSLPSIVPSATSPPTPATSEKPGQRLADGDPLPHLLLREPFLFADHFALHMTDERDGTAKPEEAEAKVIPDELADRHALLGRF